VYCITNISLTFGFFLCVSSFRVQFGRCCRVAFFKGLYRKNPAGANIGFLALEWANYFFTVFVIVVRMVRACVCVNVNVNVDVNVNVKC
jgi:hypothetical protein